MKTRKQLEKWGMIALAGLCAMLVIKLVSEINGNPVPADDVYQAESRPPSRLASSEKAVPRKGTAFVKSDRTFQMLELEKYVTRPLPDVGRNPFDFGAPPITSAQRKAAAAALAAAAANSAASPASGIPLRAIGYSLRIGVGPEAYLADSDQVYVVHDGDVISHRYKIVEITSSTVQIKDGVSGERARLPIPLVQ